MFQNPYYAEQYMQQHRQELLREADQMRLVASVRNEGKAGKSVQNLFGGILMAQIFRLKPRKQFQPQPKAITSQL